MKIGDKVKVIAGHLSGYSGILQERIKHRYLVYFEQFDIGEWYEKGQIILDKENYIDKYKQGSLL